MELQELNKTIDNWAARGLKWVKDGQALALLVLERVEMHGDIGPANRMLNGMPKGTKRNALAEWFVSFGKLTANEDKASMKDKPLIFDRAKATNMTEAQKKPWYEFQPEPPIVEVFDAQAAMIAALKSIRTKAGKANEALNLDVLDKVEALFSEAIEAE